MSWSTKGFIPTRNTANDPGNNDGTPDHLSKRWCTASGTSWCAWWLADHAVGAVALLGRRRKQCSVSQGRMFISLKPLEQTDQA